ncbi:DUF11 domain-containing protein [Psychrobacter glacincola]|uniref:DUF11 domain-containing protein n=1 Tax=Psychrobacter glacincola TaxID=56810 RepID=A0ABW1W9S6_9GAMM|nr:DUF11 domain-containing protein [Psychrobacter glacincola]|tara:strand:+ start:7171 stop:9267 length:2097 start_codon:yes stop_codon:yes gene_type:complete
MKSNTFNYSLLAIGVAAVLGLSTAASAVETPTTTTGVDITNQATANYSVAGQAQPEAKSNIVKVSVSQQVSFSLTADNNDTAAPTNGVQGDNKNENIAVTPNGFVLFEHTLKNTGNTTDTYDITVGATDPKYTQNASTVTFTTYKADGTPITDRTNITLNYMENTLIPSTLEKGEYVKFTIRAKTSGNKGEETLPLQLSVTSRNLAGIAGATKTLINTDTSFTRLPTFGIVKTITNGLDLNDTTYQDTATYKVVVTNDGTNFSADATNITIEDVLPNGLVMAKELIASNITVSTGATKGTIASGSLGSQGFSITNVNLPIGQSITITFEVKQTGAVTITPTVAMGMINHVTVTDDLDEDAATTGDIVIDSTKTGSPENVSTFYPAANPEVNYVKGETPAKSGDDSTVPLLTIKRELTLTGVTTKEIAPVTGLTAADTAGQVTHSTVITNTGKDVEGSKPGELTFTITDNDGGVRDAINVVPGTVKVTYNPGGTGTGVTDATITPVNGIYDINTVLTAGIKAGGIVTITYNVSANDAPLFNPVTSTNDADATFEDTIVTLIPVAEGAPTPITVTDKTTVRGLVLVKKQALAVDCAATSTGIVGSFVTTDITGALPGQCIVYQIQARNTSTTAAGFPITSVTILDEFSKFAPNATYVIGSLADMDGAEIEGTDRVTTTLATLAAQGTATMQFKVKIKTGL